MIYFILSWHNLLSHFWCLLVPDETNLIENNGNKCPHENIANRENFDQLVVLNGPSKAKCIISCSLHMLY